MVTKYNPEYQRQHYQNNKELYKTRANESRKRIRDEIRAYLQNLKQTTPCKDCGKIYPYYVMDFDHLRDKDFQVSQVSKGYSMDKIKKEIEKCELVCANCHRIRTYKRSCSPTAEAADLNPAQCQFESD